MSQHRVEDSVVGRLLLSLLTAAGIAPTGATPPWTNLPARTHTHSGTLGDPVNIAFEGSRSQILAAFKAIGWVQADPLSARDDVRHGTNGGGDPFYTDGKVALIALKS